MGGLFRRMGHAKPYVYTSPIGCANDVEGGTSGSAHSPAAPGVVGGRRVRGFQCNIRRF